MYVCSDYVVYFRFCLMCDIFVCFDECSIIVVVECSLFLLSPGKCMFCNRVEWVL